MRDHAATEIPDDRLLNRRQFGSTSAFEQVFRDACPYGMHQGSSYQGHHGIPAYWPTNPDAEIHVLEPIQPEFILHGWVETPELGAVPPLDLEALDCD